MQASGKSRCVCDTEVPHVLTLCSRVSNVGNLDLIDLQPLTPSQWFFPFDNDIALITWWEDVTIAFKLVQINGIDGL